MALNFGTGVSRTLDPVARAFQNVVFQKGKPPLDSEFNLQDSLHDEQLRQQIATMMPSGFVFDPTRSQEYFGFDPQNSNQFRFGQVDTVLNDMPSITAVCNGMVIQVAGTDIAASVDNVVRLYPAPTSNARTDLVFLEVWRTLVSPNPSATNKPSASTIWKYGNVKFGGTNLPDDLQDGSLGFETTKRVQTQYRIRVVGSGVSGVDLASYPDGLDSPSVLGQGTAASPQAGLFFTNMGKELGDPSLWRAGDGNSANALGTVDGYVYALPICAVFRRNSSAFVAASGGGAANQNGSFGRTPSTITLANPLTGAKLLTNLALNAVLTPSATLPVTLSVTGLVGSGFDDPLHYAGGNTLFATIGEEIVEISSVNTGLSQVTIASRGRYKTQTTYHASGSAVSFYSVRPDGLFADQVAPEDLLDLRRAVNAGAWDYNQLLTHNLAALLRNRLRSTWKQSLQGNSQGAVVTEVDYMFADNPGVPVGTNQVDGPDGIRTIFSDAAVIQRDVTLLLDNDAPLTAGFTSSQFDTNMVWDVGASFVPSGFVNNEGQEGYWTNGSVIFVHVEGTSASGTGARASFKWAPSARAVKFLAPKDYWKVGYPQASLENGDQYPVKLRFVGPETGQPPTFCLSQQPVTDGEVLLDANAVSKHPGPLYPFPPVGFETPFIVLGDLLNSTMYVTGRPISTSLDSSRYATEGVVEIDTGVLDFDTATDWYTVTSGATGSNPEADFAVAPTNSLTNPLLGDTRTLFDMLTQGGQQRTGLSSDVYVVVYGDDGVGHRNNNGVFKVIGAGTASGKAASLGGRNFTSYNATNATSIVCQPMSADFSVGFNTTGAQTVSLQFRSQTSTVYGGTGNGGGGVSAMCIVLTDIGGQTGTIWNAQLLGQGATAPEFDFSVDTTTFGYPALAAKAVLTMALQYSPARGAQTHVPNTLNRFALTTPTADYLRQPRSVADPTFPTLTGAPSNEADYKPVSIQLWNRLPACGWDAGAVNTFTGLPTGISFGGNVVANTEQDRESELFADLGSKSVIFRPFRQRNLTLQALTVPHDPASAIPSLIGDYNYPAPFAGTKDGLQLFTTAGTLAPYDAGTASSGKNMAFAVPPEYMPRFGRQDIPYYLDVSSPSGSGVFLEGINHLFLDTTDPTQGQTAIMGGRDNAGPGNAVYSLFLRAAPTSFPGEQYGDNGTMIDGAALNRPFYVARRAPLNVSDAAVKAKFSQVLSSDLGSGLKGIQLPPYLGIARLYGVYEYSNYVAGGGVTWSPDRSSYIGLNNIAPLVPVQNLLRTDADAQSLFIMQDGASDLTLETGDHTYIVPSNAIDVTRVPGYVAGQTFDNFEYVVECTVFGFAKNWINGNNYVLCRRHDGEATLYQDGQNPQILTVQMVLPSPAHLNAPAYSVIDRTVYQGDPYFTRTGTTPTITDYQHRYGTVPLSDASQLQYPIQQFDSSGNFIPLAYNPRALEVLSSIDFYTTMGTGKIGGKLFAGTPLDVGYLQNTPEVATRIPPNGVADTQFLDVWDRAFTEGQRYQPNRAGIVINTLTYPVGVNEDGASPEVLNGMFVSLTGIAGNTVTKRGLISPVDFNVWASQVTANSPMAGVATVQTTREHGLSVGDRVIFTGTRNASNVATGLDGTYNIVSVLNQREFVLGGSGVSLTVTSQFSGQVVLGEESGDSCFPVASRSGSQLLTATANPNWNSITVGAGLAVNFLVGVAGAKPGDAVTINFDRLAFLGTSVVFSASVSAANQVTVRMNNPTAVPYSFGALNAPLYVTVTPRIVDTATTLLGLADKILTDPIVNASIRPSLPAGTNSLLLQSTVAGTEGNRNYVAVGVNPLGVGITARTVAATMELTASVPLALLSPNLNPTVGEVSSVFLTGFTGPDAALVNDRFWPATVTITGTGTFTIPFDSTVYTVTVATPAGASAGTMCYPQRGAIQPSAPFAVTVNRNRVWLTDPTNSRWISQDSLVTSSNFVGGMDVPVNAGLGISNGSLMGMTERLPLGILLSDCDFLSENPLNDAASAVQTFPSALRPIQKLLPLSSTGQEYERFLGAPGDLVAQADGSILYYTAYNAITAPAGIRAFRMYRGGGSLYTLDGATPGGPVDWATTSFPPAIRPVLKGGVLVGKAMLVRNFPEQAFGAMVPQRTTSYGDEIQMLIATYGVFGSTSTTAEGLTLAGSIGTAGYGEGYGASDRYRIEGKPMFRDTSARHVDPASVTPTPYVKGT